MSASLANGQLAATATNMVVMTGTAASGQSFVPSADSRVNVVLMNTSAVNTETVQLSVKLSSGTARNLPQIKLLPLYGAIITNLTLDALDTLIGTTTDATTVDYRVSIATGSGPLEMRISDTSGNVGSVSASVSASFTTMTGAIGASTAAAGTTTADAGALPAGTGNIYPTTAADGTKGVRISATDQVTGRMIYVGNGVSNAILKIYAPSGGTINGAAADAAYSTASGKGAWIVCLSGSGNTWLALG